MSKPSEVAARLAYLARAEKAIRACEIYVSAFADDVSAIEMKRRLDTGTGLMFEVCESKPPEEAK